MNKLNVFDVDPDPDGGDVEYNCNVSAGDTAFMIFATVFVMIQTPGIYLHYFFF